MERVSNEVFRRLIAIIKNRYKVRQSAIAMSIDVTPSYLSMMVSGKMPVPTSIVDRLTTAYPDCYKRMLETIQESVIYPSEELREQYKEDRVKAGEITEVVNTLLEKIDAFLAQNQMMLTTTNMLVVENSKMIKESNELIRIFTNQLLENQKMLARLTDLLEGKKAQKAAK